MRASACLTALLIGAAMQPLVAQRGERAQQAVPRDLVVGLLRMQYGQSTSEPELVVGRMPDALARRVRLPAGASVLGSVIWPEMTTVLVRSSLAPDSSRADVGRLLLASGWEEYRPRGRPGGGFVPSSAGRTPSMYCRGDTSMTASALARGEGGSEIRLVETTGRVSACGSEVRFVTDTAMGFSEGRGRPPMPILHDPPASAPPMPCFQSGTAGMSMSTGTTLRTSLTTDAILAHYARQLESDGWKPAAGAPPAIGTWARIDSAGRTIEATLRVAANPGIPDCRTVSMEVRRSEPRR